MGGFDGYEKIDLTPSPDWGACQPDGEPCGHCQAWWGWWNQWVLRRDKADPATIAAVNQELWSARAENVDLMGELGRLQHRVDDLEKMLLDACLDAEKKP